MYHNMTKATSVKSRPKPSPRPWWTISITACVLLIITFGVGLSAYDAYYENKIYPNVIIDGVSFGGKSPKEVETYWQNQNIPFAQARFEFKFDTLIATVSGTDLELGYDATFSAVQAYSVGRSGNFLGDLVTKFLRGPITLTPYFRWKSDPVHQAIGELAARIDIPVENALFQFDAGRVTAFRASRSGRAVQKDEALDRFESAVKALPHAPSYLAVVNLPVYTIEPSVATEKVNSFGIKELIGRGYSEFTGSIAGRIHNIRLAASRLNGTLIAPGETLSFNDTVGDISTTTGYQPAYIIKEGRTVLGDGGGVCQVSTTLFRAALAAGLPITERRAHAYRVKYYELAGFKPGLDATVFSPSVDQKIKNDTPAHILIQTKTDTKNMTLTFELYGTHDGRSSEITNHIVWDQSPPPEPLYQDDPTLAVGVTKQVDWAAWGAKASFNYRVTRGNEVLQDTKFVSVFRPWQAVYLKGTATQ